MKNKKGFTLVELLAVIAILAVLVIIALPNVLRMFRGAKKDSFETEVKSIATTSEKQWLNSSFANRSEETVYSKCETGCNNDLNLNARNELNYYAKLNMQGEIKELYVSDGEFQYIYDGSEPLDLTNIDTIQNVAELDENQIIRIDATGYHIGDLKIVETISQKTEGKLSPGDEIVVGDKEHFNVVSSDSEKTVLLAKYNLYVGYNVKSNPSGSGKVLDGQISTSDSNYGWQYEGTRQNSSIALVPYSGKMYWQDPTNKNKFLPADGDFFDESTYKKSLSTVAPVVSDYTNQYGFSTPKVAESDYSIAYYVEPYVKKINDLGLYVYEGGILSHSQIISLGGGYSGGWRNLSWLTNTFFWTGSVYWHGRVDWQNSMVAVYNAYSPTEYNGVSAGVRPTITVRTSDIPLLPHEYFDREELPR